MKKEIEKVLFIKPRETIGKSQSPSGMSAVLLVSTPVLLTLIKRLTVMCLVIFNWLSHL